MTQPRRLRAPADHGAVLADPPLECVDAAVQANCTALERWQHDFQGRSSLRIRAMTRHAVLAVARRHTAELLGEPISPSSTDATSANPIDLRDVPTPPIILSGHQPELFHPGVWIKNFASQSIARRHAGVALHLIVDNDTVKRTTVRVPTGSRRRPSVVHLPLDRWRGEVPFEEYEVADEGLFESFGARLSETVGSLGFHPIAGEFWKRAVAAARRTRQLGERIAAARRQQEAAWGCENLELPVSRLCQTEGFYWFASHVLAQLPPFAAVYNSALSAYRKRNRIRSDNHPVPGLERDGDWLEAPFWIWNAASPRRRRLFAQQQGRELVVTDRDQWTGRLPLAADREACCAVEMMDEWARAGIKIRTRALTTTIFTRLCLAELFIHGLGGARYDELADEIIRRFFVVDPPRYLTLTGTLRLPLPPPTGALAEMRQHEARLRDLEFNPDRHLDETRQVQAELAQLVREKREWIRREATNRDERRNRAIRIRQINAALARSVDDERMHAQEGRDVARGRVAIDAILTNREWPFCAYPESVLRDFFRSVE